MSRYATQRSVLIPTTMLERLADELVEVRRANNGMVPAEDDRVVKVIRELRMLADLDP